MAKLIYSAITSLDGYVADENGNFDWGEPDEEVHTFVNDLGRNVETYLYGRRLYEVMAAWETMDPTNEPPHIRDFAAIWKAADKIVYSRTLQSVSTPQTRLERDFDAQAVGRMKTASVGDMTVGGPELAAHAFRAGIVDECQFFLAPVVVGGGKQALPDRVRFDMELDDERRFRGGMVYVRYRIRTRPSTFRL